jgi:thiamine pyrophosphate-dependent acetolactate synthase large subunit-like protein
MLVQSPRTPFLAVVVTADQDYFAAAAGALADARGSAALADARGSALHDEAVARARRYLERSGAPLAVSLVQAPTLEQAVERCATVDPEAGPVGIVFIDAASSHLESGGSLEDPLERFYERLAAAGRAALRSPCSVLVHRSHVPWSSGMHTAPDRYTERLRQPGIPWLLRTELLVALLEFVERTMDRPRHHRASTRSSASALGDRLVQFLSARRGADWTLLYYTGSSIAPFIEHTEALARERGVLALRAANEHGLAAGALANHLLYGTPFLMVVGIAMMDELRGTLANLCAAGACGFIVCPEAGEGTWFTFQGTITPDEDMRAALAARGVRCVYLDRVATLDERLEQAFRSYEEGRGPVVLLATQEVLDEKSLPEPAKPLPPADLPRVVFAGDDRLERAVAIVNEGPARLLWQAGRLSEEEAQVCETIAERAGIALCDTLGHPGPTQRDGKPIANYLGTLGLYGFRQRVHAFLHEGGKLRPREDQCLFFVKSKVGQRAVNFTPFRREGLRMVQVTHRADHVAPDAEIALVMDANEFLRAVHARLDVDPVVLRRRREALEAAHAAPELAELASVMPSLPMAPSAFFRRLGDLVSSMIEEDGYTYTGVYDVGRCSVSALRSVARTTRGFSGWYGRALMGDAPAALPVLAVRAPGNVVAFIGDGARAIIADPVPALLDNATAHPERFDKNVTVFCFSNGTYSGIRSYRERLASRWGGRQMRALDLLPPDGTSRVGRLEVVRRRILAFDRDFLRKALLARGRLNLFTVFVAHATDDDAFTLVTTSWERGD